MCVPTYYLSYGLRIAHVLSFTVLSPLPIRSTVALHPRTPVYIYCSFLHIMASSFYVLDFSVICSDLCGVRDVFNTIQRVSSLF